jgi:type III secretory pathway component EscU
MACGIVCLCKGRLEVYEHNLKVFVFTVLFVFLVRTVCVQIKNTHCTACEAECEIPIFEH